MQSFLKEMLKGTVGEEQAAQIETQIHDLVEKRDPFIAIRSADSEVLASVLEGEHPQAVAVVLSEMPPKKSSAMLGLLGEGMRLSAISRMTSVETVTAEAKARIAQMVRKRLEATAASEGSMPSQARPEQSLRKVAVILRNVEKELRDGVLTAIQQKDKQASEMIADLMIVWNDIPQIADRSLQEALRGTDSRQLALALHKADEVINRKVRSNISERAAAMIDEEISLMPTPKKEEVKEARETIVKVLREMNSRGELTFVEE
jgi:flagellar motor switch protein FliG